MLLTTNYNNYMPYLSTNILISIIYTIAQILSTNIGTYLNNIYHSTNVEGMIIII